MVKKRYGFSLVELLVAVAIILVLAGGIILNINSMKTTPKKEAEKVAHFLITEINKADKGIGRLYLLLTQRIKS